MSFAAIKVTPLAEWTAADLQKVCDTEVEESSTIEFKGDLARPDDGWRKNDRSSIASG